MLSVYDVTEKKFNHNGIKILHPLFAEITKVDNGDYYIELEDVLDNLEYYQKGMIIRVDTPWGVQGFRCDNPLIENNRVTCKAWHLFYDSKNYVIAEKRSLTSKNCKDAIKHYNLYTDVESPFTVSSDMTEKVYEADTVVESVSLYSIFEYLTSVYGGHWVRDNYNFSINKSIGQDRGVVLAYNKNITDIKVDESWDNVCTKIMPYTMVGDEKITLVAFSQTNYFVKLEETLYDIPYTKVVEFKNEFKFDGNPTTENYAEVREWLRSEATKYLQANKYPKVNYSVSAKIDNVSDVGDTIYVKHPKCKVDLLTSVISVKYDAIKGKYTEIEFGNFRKAIKYLMSETTALKNGLAETTLAMRLELSQATEAIKGDLAGITEVFGSDGTIELGGSSGVGSVKAYNASDKLVSSIDKDGISCYTDSGDCLQIGTSNNKLRIRQKSGDTWGEWRNLQEEGEDTPIVVEPSTGGVVLYTGIGSSTNVKLTPPIKDNNTFKYIEIFYALSAVGYDSATSDFHQSVKVSDPYGKKISLLSSTIDASGNVIFGVGIVKINYDSENDISKIVFETNANKAYNGSNMGTAMTATSSANKVYIRKVVGYTA